MPPTAGRTGRRKLVIAVLACVLVIAMAVLVSVLRPRESPDGAAPTTTTPTPTGESLPLQAEDTLSLTVPDIVRTSTRRFAVEEGRSYLVKFDVSTEKPADSPGTAMYLGISLACSGGAEGEQHKINGTQNIMDGEPVALQNQFLLIAQDSGERGCNVLVSSPNETAAAVGATIDVDVTWSVTPVQDGATSFPTDRRLPVVVPAGGRQAAFRETIDVSEGSETRLSILSSLHVTSCTIVNGSREGGEPLCTADETDDGGSTFDTDLRVDVLGADGEVCQRLAVFDAATHVDRRTHHQLLSFSRSDDLPDQLCGDTLELVLAVSNEGPAPLLIHGSSSSFIVVPEKG